MRRVLWHCAGAYNLPAWAILSPRLAAVILAPAIGNANENEI